MYMRKIFVLLSVLVGLTAMSVNSSDLMGTRICLLNLYQLQEDDMGNVTVMPNGLFYGGGWVTTIAPGEADDQLTFADGLAMFSVAQPFTVNEATGTVTLAVGEPFATETMSSTTTTGSVTTTVDTTLTYYVINEDYVVNHGKLTDVHGVMLTDGSIHIEEGFAYYLEQVITTTITVGGRSQQFTDETDRKSLLMRDLWLIKPNGVHEYVEAESGVSHSVPVYIRQDGDTVLVTNLYGRGWRDDRMVLADDATMSFPMQTIADISDAEFPNGDGVWYNAGGNTGAVTTSAITWQLTTPTDNNETWPGWTDNRLTYTDGTEFVIPQPPVIIIGDVDMDGEVGVSDITALLDAIVTGNWEGRSIDNADCDLDGDPGINDVTALLNYLLTGNWPE